MQNLKWDGESQLWEVLGGSDTGGLIVRTSQDLKSTPYPVKLATGAWVEECEVVGDRIHYKRIAGEGPDFGWVSIKVKAKELLVKRDGPPPELGTNSSQAVEKQSVKAAPVQQEEGAASHVKEAELEKALQAAENRNADLQAKVQAMEGQAVKQAAAAEIQEDLQKALEASEKRNADLVKKLNAMQDETSRKGAKDAATSQTQAELEKAFEASEKKNAVLLEELETARDQLAASIAKEKAASERQVEVQKELQMLKDQIAANQQIPKDHGLKDSGPQTPPSPRTSRTSSTLIKPSEEGSTDGSTAPGQSIRAPVASVKAPARSPPVSQPCPVFRAVSSVADPTLLPGTAHAHSVRQVHPAVQGPMAGKAVQVPMAGKVVTTRVIQAGHVVPQPRRG